MVILQEPQNVSPSFNDLTILVQSTNYASADFRFTSILKDGSGNTIATPVAQLLNGTDKGVFKIERIIEAYTSYDFDLENTLEPFADQNSMFQYELEIGEEYLGTDHPNLVSSDGWAFPGALNRRDFAQWDFNDYTVASGNTGVKFLTNRRSRNIRLDQWDWLYFLEIPTPLGYFINFVRYKSYNSGGLLKTVDVTFTDGSIGPVYISKVPSGRNTSEIDPLSILAGTAPVIHPAATYYTIALYDQSDTIITEEYPVYLDDTCTRYNSFNLCYQNPMGGFDSILFNCASRVNYDNLKKYMRRQLYELNGSTYAYNLNKHGLVAFDNRETKRIILNSDWLDDVDSEAVHELIGSPYVFLVSDTDYIPVKINQDTWEVKNVNTDGLFNAQIEILFEQERRQSA